MAENFGQKTKFYCSIFEQGKEKESNCLLD